MARLNAENDVSTIQVIQKALVPERKSKPIRRKTVTVALIVSLFGSCLVSFLLEGVGKMSEEDKNRWKFLVKRASLK
jgi:uncharacterized protein involved in exopolysaccharide biosynthesis